MKVKILRNGKICDMPDQNALSYIKTGQAVKIESKGLAKPAANKMVAGAPEKKAEEAPVFICPKCGKTYKTKRGFDNHKC